MRKKSFFEYVILGIILGTIIGVSMTAAFIKSKVFGWLYVAAILFVAVMTACEWIDEMKNKKNHKKNSCRKELKKAS